MVDVEPRRPRGDTTVSAHAALSGQHRLVLVERDVVATQHCPFVQASETLAQAAKVMSSQPASLQLRYLQTVTEIAAENNSTTIFPVPIDMLSSFFRRPNESTAVASAPETPIAAVSSSAPPALPASGVTEALPQIRVGAARVPAGESVESKDS